MDRPVARHPLSGLISICLCCVAGDGRKKSRNSSNISVQELQPGTINCGMPTLWRGRGRGEHFGARQVRESESIGM